MEDPASGSWPPAAPTPPQLQPPAPPAALDPVTPPYQPPTSTWTGYTRPTAFPAADAAQTPHSAAQDQLAESLALEDVSGEHRGPTVRPSTPGGPARHAAGG